MNILFFADIEKRLSDGIYKKICSQAKAFSSYGKCTLLYHYNNSIYADIYESGIISCSNELLKYNTNSSFKINKKMIKIIFEIIKKDRFDLFYYRHSLKPSYSLHRLFKKCKKNGIKVICEIPTYPYFYEQVNNSNHKFVTFNKMLVDHFLWIINYRNIDLIVTILSNSKKRVFKKMFIIENAIDKNNVKLIDYKDSNKNIFNIIGVGTIFKYHGYDRIINQLYECKGKLSNGNKVIFHIVGDSDEINNLRKKSISMGITDNVVFYGKKYSNELDGIFSEMDMAVGCIALYRRHANIDTTLKVIEYTCRGIPFVTSGQAPSLKENDNILALKISNNDANINFDEWKLFCDNLGNKEKGEYAKKALEYFTWENNIERIINKIKSI